jgi:hypothetical protein
METIEDILREMRYGVIPKHRHDRELLMHFADRIESAHKREREKTCEKSSQVGNAAAMRTALEKFSAVDLSRLKFPLDGDSSAIYNSDKKEITIPYWRVAELLNEVKVAQDMAKSALSAPPRNINKINNYGQMVNAWNEFVYHRSNGTFSLASFFVWLFETAKGEQK